MNTPTFSIGFFRGCPCAVRPLCASSNGDEASGERSPYKDFNAQVKGYSQRVGLDKSLLLVDLCKVSIIVKTRVSRASGNVPND